MPETTIYRARRVVTLTPAEPEAFAVAGGRVLATGRLADLRAGFPDAEQVDLGDGVVVPGFNDAHMHIAMTAEDLLHLDLSVNAVRSVADILARVGEAAAGQAPGTWIRGSRYDDGKMAQPLTRWDLDEAAPDHPVLVVQVAGHWGVVNSAALRAAGIDEDSAPPPGGSFGRDATGRLNGVLFEQALFDFAYPAVSRTGSTVVPQTSFEEKLTGLGRAVRLFHAAGLTSITDALIGPDDLRLLIEGERRGLLTLRTNVLIAAEHYEAMRRVGLTGAFGGDRLRIAGIKTFVDGAIGGRTCLLETPFEGTTDDYGIQTRTEDELRDTVRMAQRDGMPVGVHANGDRAIGLILGLFEEAQAADPRPGLRHRIEHCTVVTEDILRRMRRLDAIAVPFGSYVHYHGGRLLDWYGEERLRRMFAHRWFTDAGVLAAGSSDFPCGPFEPLLALQSCVTRRGWDGPVLGENQRLSAEEALALYTVNAAASTGESACKGRLAPGMLADFVVLGADPVGAAPDTLSGVPVRETYVGGVRVWAQEET